jgi:hypothetical protein
MEYKYNDGLCNGSRWPKLWLVHAGKIIRFQGTDIPGLVAITSSKYEKGGKWSNTTYQLELAAGVTPCYLLPHLHGRLWPDNTRIACYQKFIGAFCPVSFEEFERALARDFPRDHERMLAGEKSLASLDQGGVDEPEIVEISTLQPCRRDPHCDVRITAPDRRSWVLAHEATEGTQVPGVFRLIQTRRTPPRVTTLVLAVTPGVTVKGEFYPKDGVAHPWALGREGDGTPSGVLPSLTPDEEPVPSGPVTPEILSRLRERFGK